MSSHEQIVVPKAPQSAMGEQILHWCKCSSRLVALGTGGGVVVWSEVTCFRIVTNAQSSQPECAPMRTQGYNLPPHLILGALSNCAAMGHACQASAIASLARPSQLLT